MSRVRWATGSFIGMAIGLALLLLCSGTAQALTIKLSLSEMTGLADTVVTGTVVSTGSNWNAERNNIYTEVVIAVSDNLKGDAGRKAVTVILPGGKVGEMTQWVEDTPTFTVGESVGLFLDNLDDTAVSQMGLSLTSQAAEGNIVAGVIGGDQGKINLSGNETGRVGAGITADSFKQAVQMTLAGQPAADILSQDAPIVRTDAGLYPLTGISPNPASAGTNTVVTVTGSGFGAQGTKDLMFFMETDGSYYYGPAKTYDSWTDTQIQARVPVWDEYGYPYSAASGPVKVYDGTTWGSPIDFGVTFGYGGYKWAGTGTGYRVNTGGVAGRLAAVQAGATSWTDAGSAFGLTYAGTHSNTTRSLNGTNEVLWQALGAGILGQASIWSSGSTITECDFSFATAYTWSYAATCPAGQFDIQSTGTHEMGHWLFLRDLYGNYPGFTQDTAKVMYGYGDWGSIAKRTLHAHDILGINWIYGAATPISSITVTSPNGSETWASGASQAITWTSNVGGGNVNIELSRDGGLNWTTIFANTPNDGTQAWTVTTPTTVLALIKVSSAINAAVFDVSNANFTITGPSITLTSPTGGETWGTGQSRSITWSSSGVTGNVNIQLSRNGGSTYTTIVPNTLNDGTQAWTVTAPVTATARIRVVSVSAPSVFDASADFAIATPPVAPTLLLPTSAAVVPTLTPTLDWNDSAGALSYGVQVAAASTFATPLVSASGLGASTHAVPGATLNWNTTYYWRANAANIAGNSTWSAMRTFKTALGPPPEAPYGLTATENSSTRIDLAWTDNSTTEVGFKIERKKAGTATFALVATVGQNVTTYINISGLTANTQYYYRVRAYNFTSNYSAYSNEDDATTLPLPPLAPTLLLPTSGAVVPTQTPTLDWNEPVGAATYGVQVATSSTFATLLVNEPSLGASTHIVPGSANLAWGTTYYWRANAVNSYLSASRWSAARTFKTALGPPPNVPTGLTATAASSARIDLDWQDNSDNEAGFKIERKKAGTATYALVATVGPNVDTYSNISGLTANTQYYYRVRAYNFTSNYSDYCTEASATTGPLAPTLLAPASNAINQSLAPRLDWNNSIGAVSYGVQVSTDPAFASTVVDEVGRLTSDYDVPGPLIAGTLYYWRTHAVNVSGSISSWSLVRSFRTAP